jgi:DnaJ-class molecular chaperone
VKRDYYEMLGLARSADQEDVRGAFKRRAHLHPDKHPGDEGATARYAEITEAYATLSDPDRRAAYDRDLDSGAGGVRATGVAGADLPPDYVEGVNFTVDLGRELYEATKGIDPKAAATNLAEKVTTPEGREEIKGAWASLRALGNRIFASSG